MKTKSLKGTLIAALGGLLALFALQAATVWFVQKEIKRDVTESVRSNTLAMAQMSELAVLAQQIRRYEKEYFVYIDTPVRRANYMKEWSRTADQITALLAKMRSNQEKAFTPRDLTQVSIWWSAAEFYAKEMRQIFDVVNSRESTVADATARQAAAAQAAQSRPTRPADAKPLAQVPDAAAPAPVQMYAPKDANELIDAGKTRFSNELIKGVSALHAEKIAATLALEATAARGFEVLGIGTGISVATGGLIALALIVWLPSAIVKPIKSLANIVEEISLGTQLAPVQSTNVKEFGELTKALERMRLAQETMVRRLRARQS